MDNKDKLIAAVAELNEELVLQLVYKMAEEGSSYEEIQTCLNVGIEAVQQKYERAEFFIGDLIVAGMIYQNALAQIQPLLCRTSGETVGRVVIGVVEGDIHDIGKGIIVSLLRSENFEVIDLGVDVVPRRFVHAVSTYLPDVLLISGIVDAAGDAMKRTMDLIVKSGVREVAAVMIGGPHVSQELCDEIGADGWAYETADTVNFCKKIVEERNGK